MSNTRKRIKTKRGKHTTATQKPNQHVAALHAEIERLDAMTNTGLRRIRASFPEIAELIGYLAWIITVTDPTAGRTLGPIAKGAGKDNVTAMLDAAGRVSWAKRQMQWVGEELAGLNRQLADKLDPTDHDRYQPSKPQCWKRGCKLYSRRQKLDAEVCEHCGEPFGSRAS